MSKASNRFHFNTFRARLSWFSFAAVAVVFGTLVLLDGAPTLAADDLQIVPATKVVSPVEVVAPAPEGDQQAVTSVDSRGYAEVFRSIPFSRAEYNANPSYRHDAAMEILFGKMRPTTIVRNAPEPIINRYDYITPYYYNRSYGNGFGYGRSYNFFYPRPTVYRNY